MKQGLTHIIFIVDRSGSMDEIAADMVGGFNSFIKKQKEIPGECFVSFYQFDDVYERVFERKPLSDVPELTTETYCPRGSTALFDSVGRTIKEYGEYLASLKEEDRPERILVIIITDGLNNASRTYNFIQVNEMIAHQRDVYKWDFNFLGSDIDAWDEGAKFGIAAGSTLQFSKAPGSTGAAFRSLSDSTGKYRTSAVKCCATFDASAYAEQDKFLAGDQKAKNQQAAQASKQATPTSKPKTK